MIASSGVREGVAVQSIQLEHREPMRTVLAFRGCDEEMSSFIDLTGRPGPALRGKEVIFEPARTTLGGSLEGLGALSLPNKLDGQGVLVEASVLAGRKKPTIRLVWFGRSGECSIDLHECATNLTDDEALASDSKTEKQRRARILSRLREWLEGWVPNLDYSQPPLTFEESIEGDDDELDSVPLSEMIGHRDYAPTTHLPAEGLEVVTLGELAKLAQLREHVHPCHHARLPHVYLYLTTYLIPTMRISRRIPHERSLGSYLYGEQCPECAIEGASECEGIEL